MGREANISCSYQAHISVPVVFVRLAVIQAMQPQLLHLLLGRCWFRRLEEYKTEEPRSGHGEK